MPSAPVSTELALRDKTRHVPARVLACLRQTDIELSAQEIAEELGIHVQTVRNSLAPLVAADGAIARQAGRMKMYRIRPLAEQQTNKAA